MSESSSGRIRCVVVTPETTVLDAEADFIAFPAFDGEVGVLHDRAPLVARLGVGELRLTDKATGRIRRFFIDGGFAQIRDNVVTILTTRAKPAEDLNVADLEKRLTEVSAEVPSGDEAIDAKMKKVQRVRAQIHVAKK